jgi:DNA polymerase-1
MPEALEKQLPYVKRLTQAMGLGMVEQNGVESDDLLASQAVARARAGETALVVSSDKDFAQIIDERITVLLPPPTANPKLGWRHLDAVGVQYNFGVPPTQIAVYLALVGDTSDNIRGIDGVGPKTAAKWLQAHGSLEGVMQHAMELEPARFRDAVAASGELLRRNLRLTTLNLALPVLPPAAARPCCAAGPCCWCVMWATTC